MNDHKLYFIGATSPDRKSWLGRERPKSTCSGTECTVKLPEAPDRGSYKIECETCPAWALVTVEKSVSDPREFTMPCGSVIWPDNTNLPT